MAANDYIRTVNITPLSTSYSWDTPPSWITITRIGTSNDWTITLAANSGSARNATLTVRHANTTTVDTIAVSQNGISVTPTATPTPTSGGGAGPTATPIVPTSTPIPPTATSSGGAGYTLSFVDSSFYIDDYTNGAGSYVDLVYNISGTTSAPVLVEKDSRISWTNRSGPTGGVGEIRITSLMPAAELPVSVALSPNFKISHPLNSSVVASIPGNITQAEDNRFTPSPTATSVPSPTSVPGGGGGGGGCLIGGTKITLADNSVVNIEELYIGLQLKSTIFGNMPNTDNVAELKTWSELAPSISSTTTEIVSLLAFDVLETYSFNNGLLVSSKDHLHVVKVGDSWTVLETDYIQVGNKLMSVNGEVEITSIEIGGPATVYKLDVETNDTYIANGIVTHNLKDAEIDGGSGGGTGGVR